MATKYSVDKKTGSVHSFNAGSSFDRDRTKSSQFSVFSDRKKADECAKKVKNRH